MPDPFTDEDRERLESRMDIRNAPSWALRPTGAMARTEDGWVLRTGLGAMGVGTMWQRVSPDDDRDYSAVPIDPEARDGFGWTAADWRGE